MADNTPAESPNLIAQLARSGRMRIAAALVVTALVGGGLGVIMLRGDAGGNSLLFSGLDLEEAAEIAGKLDTANIKYTLEGGGSAIFVDRAKVDQARMMLSEQGLPTRGSVGWEIFDKTDTLGETQFVQNIKKVRALEGELERTIASLDMVKAAQVHLSIPDRPLFQRDAEKPKASVVLNITGNTMTTEKVRAIRNLVASAVPGLELGAVTIADTDGRTWAAGSENDVGGAGGSNADERKSALEDSYRKKVLEVIENIAGPGAAKVTVNLEVDFNRITQSSEQFDPDGRVVRSSETVEDTESSQDTAPGDETTVANNVPTGEAAPVAAVLPKNQSSRNHASETTNYEISKTVRTETVEGGRVQRLSVAVAIDHLRVPGAEGQPATYQPRPPEELERLTALVKSAVGFSEQRGDVVTVENAAFARPDTTMDDAVAPGPFDFDKFDLVRGAEIGALLITALALVFFVLRPLISGLFARPEPEGLPDDILALKGAKRAKAIADFQAAQAAALAAPAAAGDLASATLPEGRAVGFDVPTPERLDAGIDVARISGQVKASSIKKISEVVSSHPDESIAIIRSWLAEEPSDRAA
ncbi:MAG TPA: flagellar basal-body MS-ring/collar protein FliF [Hyphomonadaceae bacterium]|nr:flagellar basal-body MS-ring/collar protein FliF [Hyphomonadaceae bacterium]